MAGSKARVPPRWFVVTAWHVHRWLVQASGRRMRLCNLISMAMNGWGAAEPAPRRTAD